MSTHWSENAYYSLESIHDYHKYSVKRDYMKNYCIIQGDKIPYTYEVKDFVRGIVKYYFQWHEKSFGTFVELPRAESFISDLCILNVDKIPIGQIDPLTPKTCNYLLNLFVPDILNEMVKKGFLRKEAYKCNVTSQSNGVRTFYKYIQVRSLFKR